MKVWPSKTAEKFSCFLFSRGQSRHFMSAFILTVFAMLGSDPSSASMYKTYASSYDRFYQSKDYEKETHFLDKIFSQNQVSTVLDVGCGTGSHLSKLAQYGYIGYGIDLNASLPSSNQF
jgi:ubiquinone/menaquinone biosynthesis C-methylase UbiE